MTTLIPGSVEWQVPPNQRSRPGARIRSYRDLVVWQRSMELVRQVYQVSQTLPACERFGLIAQMRRAAVSVPSNIAEGHERHHLREYLQHLHIARASLAELETQLEVTVSLGMLSGANRERIRQACADVGRLLAGLIRSLRRRDR